MLQRRLPVFVIGLLIIGCGEQSTKPTPLSVSTEEPLRFSVEEYLKEVDGGLDGAKEKYRGKTVEVSGVMSGVLQDYTHESGLEMKILLYAKEPFKGDVVSCRPKDDRIYRQAVDGKVTLRGRVNEFSILEECELVSYAGELPSRITLAEYAADMKRDLRAAQAKYSGKFTVIVATIQSADLSGSPPTVVLASDGTVAKIVLAPTTAHNVNQFKVGELVEMLCKPIIYLKEPDRIIIHDFFAMSRAN